LRLWHAVADDDIKAGFLEISRLWAFSELVSKVPNVSLDAEVRFEATLATIYALRCLPKLTESDLKSIQKMVQKRRLADRLPDLADTHRVITLDSLMLIAKSAEAPYLFRNSMVGSLAIQRVCQDLVETDQILQGSCKKAIQGIVDRAQREKEPGLIAKTLNSLDGAMGMGSSRRGFVTIQPIMAIIYADAYASCLEACLGVELYLMKEKRLPPSLDTLVPEMLAKVPVDPFSDGPVQLRTSGSKYWIDCVGPNGNYEPDTKGDDIRVTLNTKRQ
jgi:hypothetical protein